MAGHGTPHRHAPRKDRSKSHKRSEESSSRSPQSPPPLPVGGYEAYYEARSSTPDLPLGGYEITETILPPDRLPPLHLGGYEVRDNYAPQPAYRMRDDLGPAWYGYGYGHGHGYEAQEPMQTRRRPSSRQPSSHRSVVAPAKEEPVCCW